MTEPAPSYAARPLRVGVQLQPQHATYAELRRAVDAAEQAGVDVIFTWDHFFPLTGDADGANLSATPCSPPGPSRPSGSSSARS